MRSNLPITSVEYASRGDEAPASKTDIHANIPCVNQDFVNISGFSEAALPGQPHNIVRLPRHAA